MSSDRNMKIVVAQADTPNLIGNIYNKETISKMYEKTKKRINSGLFFGELLNSEYKLGVDPSRVTHQITDVEVMDGFLVVDVSFMSGSNGEMAKHLIETASGVLRPSIIGIVDTETKEVTIDDVIAFNIIPYHDDFKLPINWDQIK
jgi:hypothetical protein